MLLVFLMIIITLIGLAAFLWVAVDDEFLIVTPIAITFVAVLSCVQLYIGYPYLYNTKKIDNDNRLYTVCKNIKEIEMSGMKVTLCEYVREIDNNGVKE